MPYIPLIPSTFYNVKAYGAKCDGVTNDATFIQNAIADASSAGGGSVFLPGISAISASLSLAANVWLVGGGPGTGLKALAGFAAAQMISVSSADLCGVRDMQILGGPNAASASNPAITAAIEVGSSRYTNVKNVHFYYVNGWCIESIGGASINNAGGVLDAIHMEHCAQGIHLKGVSGSNNVGQYFLSNIHPEVIDNGDALLLEDINDVQLTSIDGAVAGGSTAGSMIHVKGPCSACFFTNIDLGAITTSTVSPMILVENDGNGAPTNISFTNGVAQQGLYGANITDGTDIAFLRLKFKNSSQHGIFCQANTGNITLTDCVFALNNQANTTAYDININQGTGQTWVRDCRLESPVGAGAGNVTNPVNDPAHRGTFFNTIFSGNNTTPSTVFASTPQIVRSCPGYNPRGSITAGTIGASPATVNTSQHDVLIFWLTNTANISAITIGGTSVSIPTNGTVWRVPARQAIVITYSSSAPTWQWIAD